MAPWRLSRRKVLLPGERLPGVYVAASACSLSILPSYIWSVNYPRVYSELTGTLTMLVDVGQRDDAGGSAKSNGERDDNQFHVCPVRSVGIMWHRQQPGTEAVRAVGTVRAVTSRYPAATAQDSTRQLRRWIHTIRPRTTTSAGHGNVGRRGHKVAARSRLQVRFSLSTGWRAESLYALVAKNRLFVAVNRGIIIVRFVLANAIQ